MDNISNFINVMELDWKNGLIFIAAIIILAVWVIQKTEFICSKLGISTKRMRRQEQQEQDIKELKEHADRTDDKIDKLFERMDEMTESISKLSDQVDDMKNTAMEARKNTLRDRIGQSYRYYMQKGQMTTLEKEAFDGLITSYEQSGGKNGMVHQVILPAMLKLDIIDN